MLLRQKSIVEKQIQYLAETVSLMEKTVEEIHQNGDIPIHMVIAILSATKQNNFFALVMKNFGREDLETLMSTVESYGNEETDKDWTALLLRLKELHQNGADPQGPDGEELAGDWWDRVMRLTGGDPNLVATVLKAGEDMSGWPEEAGDIKAAIQDFLSPALGHYFMQKGIIPPGMEEQTR